MRAGPLSVIVVIAGLAVLGLGAAARGDVVFVGDRRIRGEIAEETSDHVSVRMAAGVVRIPRAQITAIVREDIVTTLCDEARTLARSRDRRALDVLDRAAGVARERGDKVAIDAVARVRHDVEGDLVPRPEPPRRPNQTPPPRLPERPAPMLPGPPRPVPLTPAAPQVWKAGPIRYVRPPAIGYFAHWIRGTPDPSDPFLLEADAGGYRRLMAAVTSETSAEVLRDVSSQLGNRALEHAAAMENRWSITLLATARRLAPKSDFFRHERTARLVTAGAAIHEGDGALALQALAPLADAPEADVQYLLGRAHETAGRTDEARRVYAGTLRNLIGPDRAAALPVEALRDLARRVRHLTPTSPGVAPIWSARRAGQLLVWATAPPDREQLDSLEAERLRVRDRFALLEDEVTRGGPITVAFARDANEYLACGGQAWNAGTMHKPDDPAMDGGGPLIVTYPERDASTIRHELAHVLLGAVMGSEDPWIIEGAATLVESADTLDACRTALKALPALPSMSREVFERTPVGRSLACATFAMVAKRSGTRQAFDYARRVNSRLPGAPSLDDLSRDLAESLK